MVMPPCGTFDYVATLCSERRDGLVSVEARMREEVAPRGKPLTDNRLVGYAPRLEISSGRVVLTAKAREFSQVAQASFEIDADLVTLLRPEDRLHLVRTATADLAVSVLRRGDVVLAFGAITQVPLGDAVSATSNERDVRIAVESDACTLRSGEAGVLGPLNVQVFRCVLPGMPGHFECVGLGQADGPAFQIAERCALFLVGRGGVGGDPIEMVDWAKGVPSTMSERRRPPGVKVWNVDQSRALAVAKTLVGLPEGDARTRVTEAQCLWRVVERDGEFLAPRRDFKANRINVLDHQRTRVHRRGVLTAAPDLPLCVNAQ